jgi:TonB-dependent receptor
MSLGNSCSRFLGVYLFLSIFVIQASLAQGSGTIKGQVLDQASGESLVGANVMVVNTSIGNAADLDGNFVLRLVPAGTWTLKVSYVGYKPITLEVTVTNNATLQQNFRLVPQTIAGEEVIVTAQARGQQSAINQQLSANTIKNVVSEERIQELPDFNAAGAISRLPGVSTLQSSGEANKVVIRGLSPQYNIIAISGISLASTGSSQVGVSSQGGTSGSINNDRSVDLSMVTPYMIKSIEVYKSLTPDMNANALGGFVDMKLREAPSELHGDLMWQSGYTQKTENYGNYRAIASVSDRFFDDALGVYFLANGEKYDRNSDNMNAAYLTQSSTVQPNGFRPVIVDNVTLNRHLEERKRYGGNLILDYKFSTGILRSINMFSRLNSDFTNQNEVLDYTQNKMWFRYGQGDGNTDLAMNSLEFENDFGFMSVELKAANTYSRNNVPNSPYYQFLQTGGVKPSSSYTNLTPEALVKNVGYVGDASTYLWSISLFSTDAKENDQVSKGDFKVPINIGRTISGFFKFGGEYRRNYNVNDQNTPYLEPEGATTGAGSTFKKRILDSIMVGFPIAVNGSQGRFPLSSAFGSDYNNSFLDNKFGRMYWNTDPTILNRIVNFVSSIPAFSANNASAADPGGWNDGYFQTLPNDYDYTENYSAAYLMMQMNIGPNIMVVGGARYEQVTSSFTAYNILDGRDAKTQTYKEITVHPENHFILPMGQMKCDITDWSDIRYSYSQTLARPDYYELSPHYSITYGKGQIWAGNPNLKPAQSYNHDIILTLHNNELGLFSIGGYYKEIKNFTFYTQYKLHKSAPPGLDSLGSFSELIPSDDGIPLNTYINNNHLAYVRGIETELQTRFWYLPFPFDGLLMGINYSHIWSKATYPKRDNISLGRGLGTITYDSTRDGRLINQPNDIANAFIGYDYKGFSAKVSFVFQGNSVSYIGPFAEQDGFTADYYRVDASIRQMLPWAGLQLFLDVNNINNRMNISTQSSIGGFTNEQNYGLTVNFGVRYTYAL